MRRDASANGRPARDLILYERLIDDGIAAADSRGGVIDHVTARRMAIAATGTGLHPGPDQIRPKRSNQPCAEDTTTQLRALHGVPASAAGRQAHGARDEGSRRGGDYRSAHRSELSEVDWHLSQAERAATRDSVHGI
jgi:hypothetical protein